MDNCIFCQILSHKIPAEILYEDESMIAIQDIRPLAEVHVLVIPRKHVASMNDITPEDERLLSRLLIKGRELAHQKGIGESGYRLVINTGEGGGQTVFHLHVHVLGGKPTEEKLITRGLK